MPRLILILRLRRLQQRSEDRKAEPIHNLSDRRSRRIVAKPEGEIMAAREGQVSALHVTRPSTWSVSPSLLPCLWLAKVAPLCQRHS